ncbi:branched-chain amino acid transport system II carrier protein [Gelidibacter salicanalis]|uniref:Branched-chain amino acid transport system II carrier protein n=1 Tax=Gelidibacter salicanalis TaxID=291193 RepID=A0A934NK73_9FLAO|nr:branched-chain amino acid transport system II carrier protein [Gelidibacter salicanalis]MBJ7879467.1 branched-chain amino acid transport system II carrier protein [Gelidibacter salicanalis]
MNKTKDIFITGFALFSMFFGAGNLILPPFLGYQAGEAWLLVTIGFVITAVIIPILGIVAHAKLQGTMYDFGKKVSPIFSIIYCFIVYGICLLLPGPRTASVTHEMAIAPFFNSSSLLTSTIYFILVFIFVMNRSKVLDLLGKYLTPIIIVILMAIIGIAIFSSAGVVQPTQFSTPIVDGILEGYQTFDAIAAMVVGAVLIISINLRNSSPAAEKQKLIFKSGLLAGFGLFIIYTGLILIGSLHNSEFPDDVSRSALLLGLGNKTLGASGAGLLSILIALACFTTAVGIVTGTADYVKGLFNNSKTVYTITAIIGSLMGIVMGQFDVKYIIDVAIPALMFIYPITIILILLNVIPEKWASALVFRGVVITAFIFSIPDFLKILMPSENLDRIIGTIPLGPYNLGWIIPSLFMFIILNMYRHFNPSSVS